ncbi:hypothetical protein RCL1_005167 [Eukaryota sp. TZLM3-RCL]
MMNLIQRLLKRSSISHLNKLTFVHQLSSDELEKGQAAHQLNSLCHCSSLDKLVLFLHNPSSSHFTCSYLSQSILKKVEAETTSHNFDSTFNKIFSYVCSRTGHVISSDIDSLLKTLFLLISKLSLPCLESFRPQLESCLSIQNLQILRIHFLLMLLELFNYTSSLDCQVFPFLDSFIQLFVNLLTLTDKEQSCIKTYLDVVLRLLKRILQENSLILIREINFSLLFSSMFKVVHILPDLDSKALSLQIISTLVLLLHLKNSEETQDFSSVLLPLINLILKVSCFRMDHSCSFLAALLYRTRTRFLTCNPHIV